MLQEKAWREPRSFYVYKGCGLVLRIEDRPGTLGTRAAPPTGPDSSQHPFIQLESFNAFEENDLALLLKEAESFDAYLEKLIAAGYDLMSQEGVFEMRLDEGFRLFSEQQLVGVCWNQPGQFTELVRQPLKGLQTFQFATLSCYREEWSEKLLLCLESSASFEELKSGLHKLGLQLIPQC